jgi:ATP-dependent exoDNAse (exonuclease V) beta subunit
LGAVSYSQAEAMKPDSDDHYVDFQVNFDLAEENEAEMLADSISKVVTKHPDNSTAVLVRGRSHAQELMVELRRKGISYYAKDMEYLKHKPCVSDLMLLCRLLLHPQDSIAWVGFFKSPLAGISLADLTYLYQIYGHNFWKWLNEFDSAENISQQGRERLTILKPVLNSAIKNAGRKLLSQLIETTWLGLGGPDVLLEQSEQKDVYAVFELLIELESKESPLTIERINTSVSELFADQQADSAQVEIMTMHKSKGLEFDTVVLPALQRKKRADDHQLLLWEEFTVDDRAGYLLAPIQAAEQKEPIYQLARDIQNKKGAYEDARLLYVAATRAKKRLVLSCELKLKFDEERNEWSHSSIDKNSLLHYLKPHYENVIERHFNEAVEVIDVPRSGEEEELFDKGWYRLKSSHHIPVVENQVQLSEVSILEQDELDFDWASDVARVVGLVVHKQLELIALKKQSFEQLEQSGFKTIKTQLNEMLYSPDEVAQAFAKAKDALLNVKDDQKGQWLLGEHQDSRCEWELTGTVSDINGKSVVRNFIIDRSFVDEEGIRWIVDYKTGDHKGSDVEAFIDSEVERYTPQLRQYQQIIKKVDNRPSKLALYFPLLKQFVEVVG